MNFEEWFAAELPRQPLKTYKEDIKLGWDACKKEILEILSENKVNVRVSKFDDFGHYDDYNDYIKIGVIEEIKKL